MIRSNDKPGGWRLYLISKERDELVQYIMVVVYSSHPLPKENIVSDKYKCDHMLGGLLNRLAGIHMMIPSSIGISASFNLQVV